ncbi:protein-L-isoaspartate O-methyltransferase [Kitasatospora sp. MAA4]|uniref:protein-L-isoaspartate O-methyltransferase family protein n=1 Tax=Kitasatospora sp. MAA4 TaxID=3035093 RepID=UPI002474639B|nr:hypothetical protein [Kitasatospora sp. MAA4]MDH6134370.1 protein-L-isoaspartate O-methyltransferase [Kitasatospora sp. MAA4]
MDTYAQLLDQLAESGALGEEWRGAFERAPRSAFVPDAVWTPDGDAPNGYRRVTRTAEPDTWWAQVHSNAVVVTQLDDGAADGPGVATSSASMPSLVAEMLGHLDVRPGQSVLDVGTGTGWTSGLLCARLGDESVSTVEVDSAVCAQAATHLAAAGFSPAIHLGDGLLGRPGGVQFDRIHSTAAVQRVPAAWIEQTKPGGVIVTPWGTPYANAALLRLEVGEAGQESHGRFVGNVSFMWARAQRPHTAVPAGVAESLGASRMDPDLAVENVNAAFAIGLCVPGVRYSHTWDEADPTGTYRMVLSDDAGSWASARLQRWDDKGSVHQAGPRRIWDEITVARLRWLEEGKPGLTDFGLTVAADGTQTIWLGGPGPLGSE